MKKHIIIWEDENNQLVVDILKDGYNIIERTVYDVDKEAREFLKAIEEV